MRCDCSIDVGGGRIIYCCLHGAAPDLLAGAKAVMALIRAGELVRDTSGAMRQIPLITTLSAVETAIAKAEAKK